MEFEKIGSNETSKTYPLQDIRVLDLGTFVAGAFCTALLGDFGAEVIKVEMPGGGDPMREVGKTDGISFWWAAESRNKKSITCDISAPEGQALVSRLVAISDILTENFRPGTMEAWNLGYEVLQKINPGLIMVRVSGFGQTGPYAKKTAYGRIASAFGGLTYTCGYPDRAPISPGSPTSDYLAGVFGAFGALVAKTHRDKTGQGQVVDVGLYEPITRILDMTIPQYDRTGRVRERMGAGYEGIVPHNHYVCKDGKWIAIACSTQRIFERLLKVMGRQDIFSNPAFKNPEIRLKHREEIDEMVSQWTALLPASEILQLLDEAEVPSGPINNVRDLFEDPHVRTRENIVEVDDGVGGKLKVPGICPRLSRTPGEIRVAAPFRSGQDNESVFCGLLGLSSHEMENLRQKKVI